MRSAIPDSAGVVSKEIVVSSTRGVDPGDRGGVFLGRQSDSGRHTAPTERAEKSVVVLSSLDPTSYSRRASIRTTIWRTWTNTPMTAM